MVSRAGIETARCYAPQEFKFSIHSFIECCSFVSCGVLFGEATKSVHLEVDFFITCQQRIAGRVVATELQWQCNEWP